MVTHFEGITGGGRANTYNLVANSVDANGTVGAWVVHVDANGVATWIPLSVPGRQHDLGQFDLRQHRDRRLHPERRDLRLHHHCARHLQPDHQQRRAVDRHGGRVAAAGIQGDDIVNNGTVTTTGAGSVAININTYGVATNSGTVAASGAGSTGVLMSGSFSSLLNYGTINAPPGTFAISPNRRHPAPWCSIPA